MPKFDYAYRNQGLNEWEQIALQLDDGSTIYIDIYNGKGSFSYQTDKDGQVID